MIGTRAAEELQNNLAGTTVHRRGLRAKNHFYDCHTRMADSVLIGCHIDPQYLMNLGLELSTLDRGVFDALIDVIKTTLDPKMPNGHGFGDAPYLATEQSEPALFRRVRATCFQGLIRNFMGEYHVSIFLC